MTQMHRAFIPDPRHETEGVHLRHIFGHRATDGEIGIEIECEGNKFKKEYLPAPWRYEHDGSLRGVDNAEYIFKQPMKFEDVEPAVKKLWDMFEAYGTVLDESNRTSVHVHLNVQSFYLNRLCAFFGLYVAVEEILTAWAGEHRVGNLFCLRAKDAPGIVTKMKAFLRNDGKMPLSEGLHYSGLNIHAMAKYGSVEIRSLRGVTDPKLITDWVAVLQRIYVMSGEYEDPRLVTENFSGGGPIEFLRNILGEKYDVVRSSIDMTESEVRSALYDGIRLAQDLCYCRDWSRYKPSDPSKNPFGRNTKHAAPQPAHSLDNYAFNDSTLHAQLHSQLLNAAPATVYPGWMNTVSVTDHASNSVEFFEPEPEEVHEEPDMSGWSDDEIDEYYENQ